MIFQITDSTGTPHNVELSVHDQGHGKFMISQTFLTSGSNSVLMLTPEMRKFVLEALQR